MSGPRTTWKVGVIGAGVMGAGIAAQAANGGADVVLLDIVPEGASDRNGLARAAVDRLVRAGCRGGLMHPSVASRISIGNVDDDLGLLSDCDWIIEAVLEQLDIKQALYRRIADVRRADAIVSSNTSTIPLAKLIHGMPADFRRHFVITHYFNPPRHMRLVELVSSEETSDRGLERVSHFIDHRMGKTVIRCADRPGFIGNRLGIFWMQLALREAVEHGLTVEEADAVMRVCGFPKTGVFGLWDLVGIDLMASAVTSLGELLPPEDDFAALAQMPSVVRQMLEKGYLGRKGRSLQGFYRQTADAEGRRQREVLDFDSVDYRSPQAVTLPSAGLKPGQIEALLACDDAGGRFAWRVLSRLLHYASTLIPDVATDVASFDQAMKLGFNWTWGPFELIDLIGVDQFAARLGADGVVCSTFLARADGRTIYRSGAQTQEALDSAGQYKPVGRRAGVLSLAEVKRDRPVLQGARATLRDLGEDVWCLEFTGRVPVLNSALLVDVRIALAEAVAADKALVFFNEGPVFAAGADLAEVLKIADDGPEVMRFLATGQQLFNDLRQAPVPIVGALCGTALAGGMELLLHCHAIQAHAESRMGLVEKQVGIVPGWGGCREMLLRSFTAVGAEHAIEHCFELLRTCKVSESALEARALGFLTDRDGITMNRDRVLFDAKQKAIALRCMFQPPRVPPVLAAPQCVSFSSDGYEREIQHVLHELLCRATEPDWYERFGEHELRTDVWLISRQEAQARMRHFIETGQTLEN